MNTPSRVIERVVARFGAQPSECWLWPLSIGSHGYGQVGWTEDGRSRGALVHRVAWEAVNGPIPEELTIDHECRVKRCFNPAHLRLLTNEANARDNGQARRTRCPEGHEYDEANTYVDPGGHRRCRACARVASREGNRRYLERHRDHRNARRRELRAQRRAV